MGGVLAFCPGFEQKAKNILVPLPDPNIIPTAYLNPNLLQEERGDSPSRTPRRQRGGGAEASTLTTPPRSRSPAGKGETESRLCTGSSIQEPEDRSWLFGMFRWLGLGQGSRMGVHWRASAWLLTRNPVTPTGRQVQRRGENDERVVEVQFIKYPKPQSQAPSGKQAVEEEKVTDSATATPSSTSKGKGQS